MHIPHNILFYRQLWDLDVLLLIYRCTSDVRSVVSIGGAQ